MFRAKRMGVSCVWESNATFGEKLGIPRVVLVEACELPLRCMGEAWASVHLAGQYQWSLRVINLQEATHGLSTVHGRAEVLLCCCKLC